jgi:signal transduction histidine kinase
MKRTDHAEPVTANATYIGPTFEKLTHGQRVAWVHEHRSPAAVVIAREDGFILTVPREEVRHDSEPAFDMTPDASLKELRLDRGQSLPNPTTTSGRRILGPALLRYRVYPDGGIDITEYDLITSDAEHQIMRSRYAEAARAMDEAHARGDYEERARIARDMLALEVPLNYWEGVRLTTRDL